MIEKTSKDIKCKHCGKLAITTIQGIPYCADCANNPQVITEAEELIEIFEG